MNREERHLCAILYHLLMDADNLRAFQSSLGLPPSDDAEIFVEAAFIRDYFNWWRQKYRCSGKARKEMGKAANEFDRFCHKAFGVRADQPRGFRAPDGFLSLRLLRVAEHRDERRIFADRYCALLPSLANMRLDMLLVTHDAFVVIETKLHSPLQATQIHLQQALGKILNRLPGYERHVFYHFLVSDTTHPKLEQQVAQIPPPVPDFRLQQRSWTQVLDGLPCVSTRQREEIRIMLRSRR